ncbi:MAG: hypothetical protein AB1405_12425 [Bdellovibrionota bacterium]
MKRIRGILVFFAVFFAAALSGVSPASASLDREGEWEGEIGVGVIFLEDESGPAVSGRFRYWFTDNFGFGPSFQMGFTDTTNQYLIRGLFRVGAEVVEGRSPLEVYAEAGAGVIILDVEGQDTESALDIPFGGGFNWAISRNFGIFGGALVNVTNLEDEEFIPEFYGGVRVRFR